MQCVWPQSTTTMQVTGHLGVKTPGDPATPQPSTTRSCESSRAHPGRLHTSSGRPQRSKKLHLWKIYDFLTVCTPTQICLCPTTRMSTTVDRLQLLHFHGISTVCQHRSLHNSGHVNPIPKNCTCEVFTVPCTVWHCAYPSLWHNWNVQHSDDELKVRHKVKSWSGREHPSSGTLSSSRS